MLALPSTKMLLSQQAKLINLTSDSAEIAISGKWINMIQSRKKLIEDAFYQARGSSTKVILIQQDDNLLNTQKKERNINETEQRKEFKLESKQNKSNLDEKRKRETNNNLDTKSIDQKARNFADFFNGEIVNLE